MRTKTTVLLTVLLLSGLPGCTGTTLAERMPHAVEAMTNLLDGNRQDLARVEEAIREAKGIGADATAMLEIDRADYAKRIEGIRRMLETAERETDTEALRTAAAEMSVISELISTLRRSVFIAEAAAAKGG